MLAAATRLRGFGTVPGLLRPSLVIRKKMSSAASLAPVPASDTPELVQDLNVAVFGTNKLVMTQGGFVTLNGHFEAATDGLEKDIELVQHLHNATDDFLWCTEGDLPVLPCLFRLSEQKKIRLESVCNDMLKLNPTVCSHIEEFPEQLCQPMDSGALEALCKKFLDPFDASAKCRELLLGLDQLTYLKIGAGRVNPVLVLFIGRTPGKDVAGLLTGSIET